jgi:signal transduction histidine kinase
MNRTFDQLTSIRIVKKNQLNQFYQDRIRDVVFMAGTISGKDTGETDFKEKFGYPGQYFSAFYFIGSDGVQADGFLTDSLGFRPPVIPEDILLNIELSLDSQSVSITDIFLDETTGSPYQLMATKLFFPQTDANSTSRILVVSISVDAVNAIMLNNDPLSGLGHSGETYLVGPDYLLRSASRFHEGAILKTKAETASVVAALGNKPGIHITEDYRAISVLSSFERLNVPGLNWVILAEIDLREAMIPIYETRTRILLLGALLSIVFFISVFLISRRITRPLVVLKDAAVRLGDGQYDIDLPVLTHDEIGALTASFNTMARQIKEKTTDLQVERFGRMRSVIDGEEMERQRLSRELHDGIGQLLIAIKLRLEGLLYQDGKDIKNSIQELKRYFDQIIDEVRRISNNLMPSVLEAFGPAIAFRNLFADTEELSGLKIHFEARGEFDNLNKKIQTYIYRLTQEAINNIVKHAEAHEVWVNLTRQHELLTLQIRDDGKGFSPDTVGKDGGNGIHNMHERASLLQGNIMISSAPGRGTTILINIPIITPYVSNQDFPRG